MNWKLTLFALAAAALPVFGQTKWSDMGVETTFADGDWLMMLDASDLPGAGNQRAAFSTLRDWYFSSDNTLSLGNGLAATVVLTGNGTGTDATLTFGDGSVTITTDGTGTAEIVLPAGSIDGTEILDDTVDSADYAAASVDREHLSADAQKQFTEVLTGAGPHTISFSAATGEGYGSIHYIDQAATINVDAVVDGASFTVVTIGAIAVTVDVNASDGVRRNGSAFDTDGDGLVNSSTAGDMVTFTYYNATGWHASTDGNWTQQ